MGECLIDLRHEDVLVSQSSQGTAMDNRELTLTYLLADPMTLAVNGSWSG